MPTHRTDFRSADLADLASLWNAFYPPQFAIDAELLKLNLTDSPLFDWGASCIQMRDGVPVAFMAIKRSAARFYKGPDPDACHVSGLAFQNVDDAIDLMAHVKRLLRNRGHQRLIFGQDSRHFFPGCPQGVGALCSFLMVEGFTGQGGSFDLERTLSDYETPAKPVEGAEFRPLTEADRPSLQRFLSESFPGRWKYDVLEKAAAEGISNTIYGLLVDGEVAGFALLQRQGCRLPIGGAVWRASLGEQWGSLGPIGVAESVRGRGFGNALLGHALEYLRDAGVQKCCIDWTGLTEFYGKHGFTPTKSYDNLSLMLETFA